MCGRYAFFTTKENEEINGIIATISRKHEPKGIKTGEIFPTNMAPILLVNHDRVEADLFGWGFPNFRNKGAIINARGETVQEKPMFKNSILKKRCIVPTTGFYEWDGQKNKFIFRQQNEDILYLAGLYNEWGNEKRFVIITTAANSSMAGIHDRMPIILTKANKEQWLMDTSSALAILHEIPPELQSQLDTPSIVQSLF